MARSPLKRASGLPLSQAERDTDAYFRNEKVAKEREFLRYCRLMGIPPGQPSASLKHLWSRMIGERDDAA